MKTQHESYPIIEKFGRKEIAKEKITALIIAIVLLSILACATSCRPDYSNKPQKFHVGDKVKLDGIDPRKSFVPYDCCTCEPCLITGIYTKEDNYHFYYNLVDSNDSTLTNVVTNQIKRWK